MQKKLRIAIIDDERHVRESTEILLDRYCPDAEVVLSADPAELSLLAIRSVNPDLVLVDLTYSSEYRWTPHDLHRELQVPVVLVTAHDPDTMKEKYPNLPYLLKPISQIGLEEVVRQAYQTGVVHIESIK